MTAQLDAALPKIMQPLLPADSLLADAPDDDTLIYPAHDSEQRRIGTLAKKGNARLGSDHTPDDFVKPVGELTCPSSSTTRARTANAPPDRPVAGAFAAVLRHLLQRTVRADDPSRITAADRCTD